MNQDQSGSCLSLKISLVASEEGFYQQNDGSMIKLGTTRLIITRVTLTKLKRYGHCGKNTQKRCYKCSAQLHDHYFQDQHGVMRHLNIDSNNRDMHNVYYIACLYIFFYNFRKQFILVNHYLLSSLSQPKKDKPYSSACFKP